jgi:hypothetical protein
MGGFMMKLIKVGILASLLVVVSSCSTAKCKIEERPPVEIKGTEKTMTESKDLTSHVRVYKPDGSLQCGQAPKVDLSEMKKDLQDIQVFSSENKHDGLMRVQMCGHPTGTCNVYEISSADLDKAIKLGFKKWNKD